MRYFIDINGKRRFWVGELQRNNSDRPIAAPQRGDWIINDGSSYIVSRLVWDLDRNECTAQTHLESEGACYEPDKPITAIVDDGEGGTLAK